MSEKKCFRCGKGLQPGDLFYIVHIQVFSGFDGILIEPTGNLDRQLKEWIDLAQEMDPQELEREVYEEMIWMVCKSCRDRFVEEIQHPWEGPFPMRKDPNSILH